MNDRFKFRIWDGERENIFYPKDEENDYIEIDCDGELVGYDTYGLWVGGVNCIPMQCTGLKDKNGTLIYEGDIVEVIPEEDYAVIEWDNDTARFEIYLKFQKVCTNFDIYYDDELEVIGNVYENPDLLEK